jgi:hypothetical protein
VIFLADCKRSRELQVKVKRQIGATCQDEVFLYGKNGHVSFPEVLEVKLLFTIVDVWLSEISLNVHGIELISLAFVANLRK